MSAERVTDSDLALMQSALAQVTAAEQAIATAQTLVRFAQTHIGKVYGLRKGDRVEDNGQIIRVAPASAPDLEPCPNCGGKDYAIARDMKATRHCKCGHTWEPKT